MLLEILFTAFVTMPLAICRSVKGEMVKQNSYGRLTRSIKVGWPTIEVPFSSYLASLAIIDPCLVRVGSGYPDQQLQHTCQEIRGMKSKF